MICREAAHALSVRSRKKAGQVRSEVLSGAAAGFANRDAGLVGAAHASGSCRSREGYVSDGAPCHHAVNYRVRIRAVF